MRKYTLFSKELFLKYSDLPNNKEDTIEFIDYAIRKYNGSAYDTLSIIFSDGIWNKIPYCNEDLDSTVIYCLEYDKYSSNIFYKCSK